MQSYYAAQFEREMGCTEAEWLRWLPGAIGPYSWTLGSGVAEVRLAAGTLSLDWHEGEPRVIALIRMPRLWVRFGFAGLDAAQRLAFMKRFDLYMQRGGG